MATLADSFLADLDELSDNELDVPNEVVDADDMGEDVDGELADIEALNYDDLDSVSKLQKTQRYTIIMQGIELSNPQAHGSLLGSGTQSTYFLETGTFSKIKMI